jgi:hypothetical protein
MKDLDWGKEYSFSWTIMVEASSNEAKRILKKISHLSL